MRFSQCAWFRLIVFIASVLLFTGSSFAQNPSATVRGEITDPLGAVIPGATISARNATGQTVTVKTNRSGAYELRGLAPGKYTVAVNAKGFAEATKDLEIAAGKDQKLDVRLQIAVEQQNVVVDEDKPKVDLGPENNAGATVLKGKDLEALSDDPDELQSDLQALAGPAAGPNGGQMYIDGFSGGTLPPKASIREIRINQNPFSAQYDHLGYGRIEIFTKPGTDKFHGQLMFRENTSALNARNPFGGTHQPDYQTQQFEGNIGGPLSKKASFFLNAERRNINESNVVNASTSLVNNTPITFSQAVPNPRVGIEITPRFDYQVTANNTLTSRFEFNQGHSNNNGVGGFNLPIQAFNSRDSERNLQVSDTQIVNPRTVNETRFQFVRNTNSQNALSLLPQISVLGAFNDGGNPVGHSSTTQDHYELQNYTSMALGNHFVRFGGRLRTTVEKDNLAQNFNGSFTFSSLNAYVITQQGLAQGISPAQIRANGGGATQFSISAGNPITSNTSFDAGLYAEEDWKARPDLMISYGLRYETQNDIHDHADFAPRLGVAWAPGGTKNASPKTVFRAGFGLFYDRFGQNLVLQAERLNGINQQQFIVLSDKTSGPDFYPNIPPISTLASTPAISIRQIDSRLRAPYTMQSAATVERQLTKTANVSVTYLHSRGVHQLLSRNINAPLPGTYDPNNSSSGVRPFGLVGNINQYQSEGIFQQNQLITNFNVRGKILSLFG
ncbi:MAG TPA: carboxypeptidase regulatory-like domain-containing protein, partial [Terriglobales bacterium]|nr:carboxypeptidase regulatory-like domain-containing protein [Terriglobales bacterium]